MISLFRRFRDAHPDEESLLLYLDGEASPGDSRWIDGHLKHCWTCRAAAERLDSAARAFAESRRELTAPDGTSRLRQRLEQVVAGDRERPRHGPVARLVLAGAVAMGLLLWVRPAPPPPPVPEVLARAAERQQPASGTVAVLNRAGRRDLFEQAMLRNGLNPADPLSARALVSWRKSIPAATDAVSPVTLPDGSSGWRVVTEREGPAADQQVRSAILLIRASDLVAVRAVYAIQSQGQLTNYTVDRIPRTAEAPPMRLEHPPEPLRVPLSDAELAHTLFELHYILHRLDGCRIDSILIARTPHHVKVRAAVESEERRRELANALTPLRNVQVELLTTGELARRKPHTAPAPPDGEDDLSLRGSPALLADLMLRHFSAGRSRMDAQRAANDLSNRVIRAADAVKAEAWILDQLVRTFDVRAVMNLRQGERLLLEAIFLEHQASLDSRIGELDRLLTVLPGAPEAAPSRPEDDPGTLPQRTAAITTLVGALFAGLNADVGSADGARAELAWQMARVRRALGRFEQKTAELFRLEMRAGEDPPSPRLP